MKILELTKTAFDKGEVEQLLLGTPPYTISMRQYTPLQTPTNYECLITEGIAPLLLNSDSPSSVQNSLEEAILNIANKNANNLFFAYVFVLWLSLKNISISDITRKELSYLIARNRNFLENTTHNWLGRVSTLYQDITNLEAALNKKGKQIL